MKSATMKRITFFILFLYGFCLNAQQIEQLANSSFLEKEEVRVSELQPNQIAIEVPFAKEIILNPNQKKELLEKAILKIELVYTKYKTVESFNQAQLNIKRLNELKLLLPSIFETPIWDFRLISQTNGNSRKECDKMFHGFIFTFRPNSTQETLKKEADYLDRFVEQIVMRDSLKKSSNKKELIADIKTRWDDKIGYVHDTIWKEEEPVPIPDFFYDHSLFQDSSVLNSFNRNPNWNNFFVVTDVTGSMSPFLSQVFNWLKDQSNSENIKGFVFFNDGDNKPSGKKKPMETKGVYATANNSIEEVMEAATRCMKKGSGGGEGLENDVEAIVFGQDFFKNIDNVVLVADNNESMRDYKYIDEIKKPVHVILCGTDRRVNIQYLDLARKTKGTVHTASEDLKNLDLFKNGEKFSIGKYVYLYENNQFHYLYE